MKVEIILIRIFRYHKVLYKLLPLRTEKSRYTILVSTGFLKYVQRIVLLFIVLVVNNYGVKAQYLSELGFGGGLCGYSGELSNVPSLGNGYTFGGFYRSNLNTRLSVRVGVNYGKVSGSTDDVPAVFPDLESGGNLDFEFSTDFFSEEVLLEFNFFPYPYQKKILNSSNVTPFTFAGIGLNNYQSIDGIGNCFTVPFGVGVRCLSGERLGTQLQFKVVKLFTDKFESDSLDGPYGFEDNGISSNDWLYSFTLMISYSFNKDIWDCHCTDNYRRRNRR